MVGMTQTPDDDLLSFLDDDVRDRVVARAKELGASVRDALNDLLRDPVFDHEAWREQLEAGIADADAGRVVDHEKVEAYILSKFGGEPLEKPSCDE